MKKFKDKNWQSTNIKDGTKNSYKICVWKRKTKKENSLLPTPDALLTHKSKVTTQFLLSFEKLLSNCLCLPQSMEIGPTIV